MSDQQPPPPPPTERPFAEELLDRTAALDARIRALYRLKENGKTVENLRVLLAAVDTTDSVLLQHELIYNVGQFGFSEALPELTRIADDASYDVVTRHEALESLGAIGDPAAVGILTRYAEECKDCAPLQESAVLALQRLQTKEREGADALRPPPGCHFVSVDPSPAFASSPSSSSSATLAELEALLLNTSGSTSLWDRYRAMFSLRNIGTPEAVAVLCRGLREDASSCLFRHEVAFVLGQLEHPASESALVASLMDENEHPMVRHEAAEALGAIAEKESWSVLERYSTHREGIVKDSCVVALDMHKYWSRFKPSSNGDKDGANAGA